MMLAAVGDINLGLLISHINRDKYMSLWVEAGVVLIFCLTRPTVPPRASWPRGKYV